MKVTVCYALSERQFIAPVEINKGATLQDVIEKSGVLEAFPEINLDIHRVGVFSQLKSLHDLVHDGDRIEIYRKAVGQKPRRRNQP